MENNKNLRKGLLWVIGIIVLSIIYVAIVEHFAKSDTDRNIGAVGLIVFIIFCWSVFAWYFLKQEDREAKKLKDIEQ